MKGAERLTLSVVPGIPLLQPGDDLGAIIIAAMGKAGLAPRNDDAIVVAQKVVSKAQGRYVDLAKVIPSARAKQLAVEVDKDPRLVEVILREVLTRGAQQPGRADRRAPHWASSWPMPALIAPTCRRRQARSRSCCCRKTPTLRPKRCASSL